MIRVLICDDQAVVREGLKTILSATEDINVVGLAENGEEAVEMAKQFQPDIILMDLKMPVMNGIQATRLVREHSAQMRVLVLTTYDFDEWVLEAIRAGAAGYLLKDTPRDELVTAIHGTAQGRAYIDPSIAGKLLSQIRRNAPSASDQAEFASRLSEREVAVLRLIALGLSNGDIAARLYLSEGTVKNYVSSILTKIGAADRTMAAVMALRAGLTSEQ